MTSGRSENQLELFDVTSQTATVRRQELPGRVFFHLRFDQLVLGGVALIIGITILFAFGVERGKQLARTEGAAFVRRAPASSGSKTAQAPATDREREPKAVTGESGKGSGPVVPTALPKSTTAIRVAESPAASVSRYAIQVVAYSQPHLAKRELQRLQAAGERAFFVLRNGRAIVYVGPFPSKHHASDKLTALRSRYQDCFVKTL